MGRLQVDRAAAGLLALGLTKGDRLGMWGPNSYEWIMIQFATAKVGIVLVSCIVRFGLVHTAEPNLIFVRSELYLD